MVSYKLATQEQIDLATLATDIARKMLPPQRLEELEHADDGRGAYPMDVHMALAEAGFSGMNIPEKWGGLGLDFTTQNVIVEELSKIDAGFAFAYYASGIWFPLIEKTEMPDEEKQMWADKIMQGAFGAFAMTEPNAGSDVVSMRTTAVYDESTNEWVLNGTKCFISGISNADFVSVAAWTDKTQRPSKGITMFFVERERGYKVGKKENKMGLKLSETSELILEDVRVPADHVIGGVGNGLTNCVGFVASEGRVTDAAGALGLAQAALDTAVEYAKTRRQFGKRIIDQQGLGFLIADMQIRTDASRALLYSTTQMIDQGIDPGHLTSSIKAFIAESAMQTCIDAVQVLGGYGYMKDYPVEKYMRDAKIFTIFGGTTQIVKKDVLSHLAGRDPERKTH